MLNRERDSVSELNLLQDRLCSYSSMNLLPVSTPKHPGTSSSSSGNSQLTAKQSYVQSINPLLSSLSSLTGCYSSLEVAGQYTTAKWVNNRVSSLITLSEMELLRTRKERILPSGCWKPSELHLARNRMLTGISNGWIVLSELL
jgi:hypothetical protein